MSHALLSAFASLFSFFKNELFVTSFPELQNFQVFNKRKFSLNHDTDNRILNHFPFVRMPINLKLVIMVILILQKIPDVAVLKEYVDLGLITGSFYF